MGDDARVMSQRHLVALDGLRALAVIAVIVFHARNNVAPSALGHAYAWIAIAGWVGVDLFFVLSGFLITGILLDSKPRPRYFRNFYIRRTLRIFPLYYAVLVLALLVGPVVFGDRDPGVRFILHEQGWLWTYMTNVEVLRHDGMLYTSDWLSLTHMWSLAIEEQFYLVWPLLVYLLPRRALVVVASAIVVLAPLGRWMLLEHGVSPEATYEWTTSHLDALAVGSLLAVLVRARPDAVRVVTRALGLIGVAGVLVVIAHAHRLELDERWLQIGGLSALALGFGGVVLYAAGGGARWLTHPALVAIGTYSYGIYIFHALLLPLYRRVIDVDALATLLHSSLAAALVFTAIVVAATTAIAALSWHLFERRFLALKDRWAPTSR